MIDQFIQNLNFQSAKAFLTTYHIEATDAEINYLIPIIKSNWPALKDKQKRQRIIATLPPSMQSKINQILSHYSL